MIEVKHLVKRYGNFTAVNDISFTLEPGKIYGFLGPNGAGKSTTMNIMTGYIAATSGDISINEYDILEDAEEAKMLIGYLPEIPPLYPEMSVEEYLRFVTDLKHIKRSERKEEIDRAIAKTHLEEYRHRLIRNLSKGYRQRVGLAQAILGKPKFIILDEPTVGLDPKQILEIRCLIKNLALGEDDQPMNERPTVILSSHIMQEVSAVCDEIMIIARGRLIANDTPKHLVDQFHTRECIEVSARCDKEQMQELLRSVCTKAADGNMQLEFVPASDDDTESSTVKVFLPKGMDIREDIFCAFSKAGIVLLQLNRIVPTLEEIFLELVHRADEEAERAEEERVKEERMRLMLKIAQKEGIEDVEGISFEELEEMLHLKEDEDEKEEDEETTSAEIFDETADADDPKDNDKENSEQ